MGNLIKKMCAKRDELTNDNNGFTSIELVLLLVILVALVVIFRNQIMGIIEAAFGAITRDSNNIIN